MQNSVVNITEKNERVGLMNRLIYIIIPLLLCGCAGKGWIWEYEPNEQGELELKKATHFDGRNIKCNTEKGAGMETKNLEFPAVPFVR